MEKVYRLMHNNIERGPFSIDELLQQNIQPSDLIWEEGKKKWQFASQIAALTGTKNPQNSSREAFQNASAATPESRTTASREPAQGADQFFTEQEEFELRAQELKKDVSMYTQLHPSMPIGGRSGTGKQSTYDAFDNIDLVIHKTERSKYHSQFLLACFVFFLFIYGWYKGAIINRAAQNDDIAARPLIIPASTEVAQERPVPNNPVAITSPAPLEIKEAPPKPIRNQKATLKKRSPASINKQVAVEASQPDPQTPVPSLEATVVEAPVQPQAGTNEPPVAVERKKTLGQAIKGIFKKKNKKVDTAMGE